MHILMLSLDRSLVLQTTSGALARHLAYANQVDHLTIVVYTPASANAHPQYPSPRLTLLPTNSPSRLLFVPDALKVARRAFAQQRPSLITTQDPFATGLVGWWLRRQWRVPLLVQNHAYFVDNPDWLAEKPARNRLLNALAKFVIRQTDTYRTVNHKERETFMRLGGTPERVFTHPLGTASAAFRQRAAPDVIAQKRAALGILPHQKVVLWVGYPVGFKRVPLLLRLFAAVSQQLPDVRLLLVGDLTRAPENLVALIQQLGLQNAVLSTGSIPHEELPIYYHLADVFAITSAYEGIPRVLMEAAAAGLPMIGFDRVGVNEVIDHDENGYLIAEGDTPSYERHLQQLLLDDTLRQRFGSAAQALAQQRFDAQANTRVVGTMWRQAVRLGLKPR